MKGSPNTPAQLIVQSFQNPQFKDRPCIIDSDTNTTYTYDDMEHLTARAVGALKKSGISKGDTVSLLLENGTHFFVPWIGAMRAGAVVHPINTLYKPDQVIYALKLCQTKLLVAEYKYFYDENGSPKPLVALLQKKLPELRILLMRGPSQYMGHQVFHKSWEELFQRSIKYHGVVPRRASDTFQFICTSGTTGDPKAVVQHNGMFLPNVQDLIDVYGFSERDRTLLVNRLFHVNAQVANFFPMILLGGTTILMSFNKNNPEEFWVKAKIYDATYSSVIPPMLGMIENVKTVGLPSFKFFIVGADILTPDRHETFIEKTDIELRPGWGMTETLCWGSGTPSDEIRIASMGKSLPQTKMKIVDAENNWKALPRGSTGRLIVRGPNVFRKYFRNKEATEEAFSPSLVWGDGWFDTGDTVLLDTDGTFYFICRANADSWKQRGEYIVGPELDQYLETHPDVGEAVAVPLMIEEQTETVMLVVTSNNPSKELAKILWNYCERGRKSGKLEAHYKVRAIVFVEKIELGDTGKRNRKQMKEMMEKHYNGNAQDGWGESLLLPL